MTTVPIPLPGSEFNDFLFASIGEDKNGMLVSVLSGLARSDVDPWQEAAKLAQLSGEAATKELAALIDALPDRSVSHQDPRSIATRLIALCRARPGSIAGSNRNNAGAILKSGPWWIYVAIMCFVLGSQFLIANHQQPAKPDHVEANGANSAFPPAPTSGQ